MHRPQGLAFASRQNMRGAIDGGRNVWGAVWPAVEWVRRKGYGACECRRTEPMGSLADPAGLCARASLLSTCCMNGRLT